MAIFNHLTWTPGDTSYGCQTRIHRSTMDSFTPGPSNLIDTLPAGTRSYDDYGPSLAGATTYYYRIVHIRNGTLSTYDPVVADDGLLVQSECKKPEVTSITKVGVNATVVYTNNQTGADVVIQRKVNPGTWADRHTVTNPGTGSHSWTPDSQTVDQVYFYRARATIAGGYPDSVESASRTLSGGRESLVLVDGSVFQVTTLASGSGICSSPSTKNATITWAVSGFVPGDTAKVYRKYFDLNTSTAGPWVLRGTVDADEGIFQYREAYYYSGSESFNTYWKVELYDGGTKLTSSQVSNGVSLLFVHSC